ncbi:MAG: hypothetical protein HYZ47_00525 [Simkania negevensis]|nr:hypothetical protein [Simkania negevensis]
MMPNIRDKQILQSTFAELKALINGEVKANSKHFSYEDFELLYAFASTFYKRNEIEESKQLYKQLALSQPFIKKYWMGLASCWHFEKNYEKALKGWEMASLLDEKDPLPHLYKGETLFELHQVQEGLNELATAKEKALLCQEKRLVEKIDQLTSLWQTEERKQA